MNYFNPQQEGVIESQANEGNITAVVTATKSRTASAPDTRPFEISEFHNCFDNEPKPRAHTWASFCKVFGKHMVQKNKDGAAWSPASYPIGNKRGTDNVKCVSMAVIDIDDGTPVDVLLPRLSGYACLVHSSYSYKPEAQKYRLIIPFSVPVSPAEWPVVWARLNQLVGGCNDPATKDAARLYYKPAHPPKAEHHFVTVLEGRPIRIEDLPELAVPVKTHPTTSQYKNSRTALLEIEGLESSGPDLNFEQGLPEVVNRCAFMQFASAPENQEHLSEPLWQAMISNASRFENSDRWIHTASEHHSGYDEKKTEAKIAHALNGSAPVTCDRIRSLGFQNCPIGGCLKPNGEPTKAPAGLMGWMFHRQLTVEQANADQLPDEYPVKGFVVNPAGVFQTVQKNDDEPSQIRLCSRIDVTALTRDPESNNWGLELRFKDPDGVIKHWALPKELLASVGDSYRASLLKMGATIEPSKKARDGLAEYLVAAAPEARALSVRQPGWFNGSFVLPDAVYGRSEERVVFQTTDPDESKRFSQQGGLESWQENVAGLCQGNSRAVLSVCVALAPPLLCLIGEDNGGFHLRGTSSSGKTLCLSAGSSVWGGAGLIRTWNMTVNGLEGVATMHNDILLPLDELGQADGKGAGEPAYMLGNGQGKSRATKDGDARTPKRWRNLVLSSGEKSLNDVMASAGYMTMAGQEVRMIEINADAGSGFGAFENIHGARTSQEFAERFKRAIADHHGHAGRAFVAILANPDFQPKLVDQIKASIQYFVDTYDPVGATGQVSRVARRFGLVAAAGEMCIQLGILPWPEGEAIEACRKCFLAWVDLRGGIGNYEAEQAIAQVRRFIESHGESRFTPWAEKIAGLEEIDNNGFGKTIQRAGFRRVTDDHRTDYYILPEAYRTEICAKLNPAYVTKVLVERGFLVTDKNGKPQVDTRLPGLGKMKVYHLKADLMGEVEIVAQAGNQATDGRQPSASKSSMKYTA
jgi:uncharacterized protein (DUF927 family)